MKFTARNVDVPSCTDCNNRYQSLFCSLANEELDTLNRRKSYNLYKKNQIIFFEGNHPQGLFCIFSGKVKVHKLGDQAREQIVRFAGKGDVLGYRALLSNESYSATATALEDTVVCTIPKSNFMELLQEDSDLMLKTISKLTLDLKTAEERMMNMAQKHVRERVAEALLLIKDCYGVEEDGKTIATTLTRREIGNVAGTTTETTIRIISDLKDEGVISIKGKKILIEDEKKLELIARVME